MYIAKPVQQLYALYEDIILDHSIKLVREQLHQFSKRLFQAYHQGKEVALLEISNWHPDCIGCHTYDTLPRTLDETDIRITISRAYHYATWEEVLKSEDRFDWIFEEAIDFLVGGDFESLEQCLSKYPYLTQARSSYGHRAGLIHYVGSNGVEMWRQKVPDNLIEITKNMIEHGADPNMDSQIYGGGGKVVGLIESSAHPRDAGIQEALISIFRP